MDDLIKAYHETDFKVFEPPITIKIGEKNSKLDELLKINSVVNWAYITAWNPYSEVKSLNINEQRNKELKADLTKYIIFEGEGVGTDPQWIPEKSFLVFGIDKEEAEFFGRKYNQNAIVIGKINETPQLDFIR